MNHSKQRLISVGGSKINSPVVVRSSRDCAAASSCWRNSAIFQARAHANPIGSFGTLSSNSTSCRAWIGPARIGPLLFDCLQISKDFEDRFVAQFGRGYCRHVTLRLSDEFQRLCVAPQKGNEGRSRAASPRGPVAPAAFFSVPRFVASSIRTENCQRAQRHRQHERPSKYTSYQHFEFPSTDPGDGCTPEAVCVHRLIALGESVIVGCWWFRPSAPDRRRRHQLRTGCCPRRASHP